MNRFTREVVLFMAQGAYSGRAPMAPGTAGTAVGVLAYLWMRRLSPGAYVLSCILIVLIGTWIAGQAEGLLGKKDHPSIVIDEIAGYLVSAAMLPGTWVFIIAAFVLFRFFDIMKPYPLKRLQNLHGGVGIMFDDIGAGVYTNLVLRIVAEAFNV
ncbi:MAG TPA: phosphatidylglycerophosphatase A [Nitrospirota bacterium]|nr:phosphatidylglycerophosphatase A [Nitrospirota bacterium]